MQPYFAFRAEWIALVVTDWQPLASDEQLATNALSDDISVAPAGAIIAAIARAAKMYFVIFSSFPARIGQRGGGSREQPFGPPHRRCGPDRYFRTEPAAF
jgi:hypothetical protein